MIKKLLIPALLVVSLASCKKNKEYCWSCAIRMEQREGSTVFSTSETTTQQCGLTEEEAENVERSGTLTQNIDMGGVTITQQSTTTCTK